MKMKVLQKVTYQFIWKVCALAQREGMTREKHDGGKGVKNVRPGKGVSWHVDNEKSNQTAECGKFVMDRMKDLSDSHRLPVPATARKEDNSTVSSIGLKV